MNDLLALAAVVYLVGGLGSLLVARAFYLSDLVWTRRAHEPPPPRWHYVLPVIVWPVLWALLPIGVVIVGVIAIGEDQ